MKIVSRGVQCQVRGRWLGARQYHQRLQRDRVSLSASDHAAHIGKLFGDRGQILKAEGQGTLHLAIDSQKHLRHVRCPSCLTRSVQGTARSLRSE